MQAGYATQIQARHLQYSGQCIQTAVRRPVDRPGTRLAIRCQAKSRKTTDTSPEGKGSQREQPANRSDGLYTWTKLRIERQTHLPASREEAWAALQELLPSDEWKAMSAVFASLESIYRYSCKPGALTAACWTQHLQIQPCK